MRREPDLELDGTRIVIASKQFGELELARGPDLAMPVVAHIVPELGKKARLAPAD